MYITINGNPVDGCVYTGPFDTHDEALAFAEGNFDGDWWIAELADPADDARLDPVDTTK